MTAIVDFNGCINDKSDVSFLKQYGDIVYIDGYVSYAIIVALKAGQARKLASEPTVAMVELAPVGRWLDTERQAMKIEASDAYPNASLAAAYGWPATLNGSPMTLLWAYNDTPCWRLAGLLPHRRVP